MEEKIPSLWKQVTLFSKNICIFYKENWLFLLWLLAVNIGDFSIKYSPLKGVGFRDKYFI
jgi:hypothetical protein